eukprot:660419-Hanusia_phi.AAC.2
MLQPANLDEEGVGGEDRGRKRGLDDSGSCACSRVNGISSPQLLPEVRAAREEERMSLLPRVRRFLPPRLSAAPLRLQLNPHQLVLCSEQCPVDLLPGRMEGEDAEEGRIWHPGLDRELLWEHLVLELEHRRVRAPVPAERRERFLLLALSLRPYLRSILPLEGREPVDLVPAAAAEDGRIQHACRKLLQLLLSCDDAGAEEGAGDVAVCRVDGEDIEEVPVLREGAYPSPDVSLLHLDEGELQEENLKRGGGEEGGGELEGPGPGQAKGDREGGRRVEGLRLEKDAKFDVSDLAGNGGGQQIELWALDKAARLVLTGGGGGGGGAVRCPSKLLEVVRDFHAHSLPCR